MTKYKQFYKKTIAERIAILEQDQRFNHELNQNLEPHIYTHMIENAIGTYEVPLGVATGFLINDKEYVIPMATEEPSVIAAASNGAKIIAQNGGFKASVLSRLMSGEIAFDNPINPQAMEDYINTHKRILFDVANKAHPSIVRRGGGARKISTRFIEDPKRTNFLLVRVDVDTQEAMGANMINTILEALALHLELEFNQVPLMSILTNLADQCLVEAQCIIDPATLKEPQTIATKIEAASHLSQVDCYRTATHNKGVMNGISALVLASGNDTRAIEASMYSYAKGQPFTTWKQENGMIVGSIKTVMPIGFVGGSIALNPKAKLSHQILNLKSATELMEIIACVGLAQNFAAIYALTTDGIQKGHMTLHAKSLALSAGADENNIERITKALLQEKHMNLETAKKLLKK